VDDTWDITQDREEDVDQEICSASSLEENTNWWEDDGKKDLADVAKAGKSVYVSTCSVCILTYLAVKGILEVLWMFD